MRGYLGVVDKGPGPVEEVLRALGERPGGRDGYPGHEQVRETQTRDQEKPGGDETPERPAVPATVKARITVVIGGHLWRKIALKSALSRSLILRARFFNRIAGYCTRLRPGRPGKG